MAMHSDDDYMVTEEASVGYQKRTLIDHVNLHVKKGEILTLIGPNGVGKSTILKSIIRQLSLIAGKSCLLMHRRSWRRRWQS